MWKTTVYLPEELNAALERAARETGCSEAELIREGILSPFLLAELDHLIASNGGQAEELRFLSDVANGAYELDQFTSAEIAAASGIIQRYADLRLGLADASIAVLARRHRCRDLLTLDQRHFRVVLGPDDEPFRLLPHDASSKA